MSFAEFTKAGALEYIDGQRKKFNSMMEYSVKKSVEGRRKYIQELFSFSPLKRWFYKPSWFTFKNNHDVEPYLLKYAERQRNYIISSNQKLLEKILNVESFVKGLSETQKVYLDSDLEFHTVWNNAIWSLDDY